MANNISNNIMGINAPTDGRLPSKAQIVRQLNDSYKTIAMSSPNWAWLNQIKDIKGYDITTENYAKDLIGIHTNKVNMTTTGYLTSDVWESWAIKIPVDSDKAWEVKTIVSVLGKTPVGIGKVTGQVLARIYEDNNGVPDTTKIAGYSLPQIIVQDLLPNGTTLSTSGSTFTFPLVDTAILDPKKVYWGAIIVVPNVTSGAILWIGSSTTASVEGNSKNNSYIGSYAWINNAYDPYMRLTYDIGEWSDYLTLENEWEKIYSLTSNGVALTEYPNYKDGSDMPTNKFGIQSITSDGSLKIKYKTSVDQPMTFSCDGKMAILDMEDDTDEPLIPNNYRSIIENDAELFFRSIGKGIISDPKYLEKLSGMIQVTLSKLFANTTVEPQDVSVRGAGYNPSMGYGIGQGNNGWNQNGTYPTRPMNRMK